MLRHAAPHQNATAGIAEGEGACDPRGGQLDADGELDRGQHREPAKRPARKEETGAGAGATAAAAAGADN